MIAQDIMPGIASREEAELEQRKAQAGAYEIKIVRALVVREDSPDDVLNRADKIAAFWRENVETSSWFDPDKEAVVVFILNRRNRLIAFNMVSLGTATASLAHPREVYRAAIIAAGSAVILAHNHPSGDPSPSAADVQLTRQMREAGVTLEIPILDHVIVGRQTADPLGRGYYSFREAGLL